jgi:hypothetical protein
MTKQASVIIIPADRLNPSRQRLHRRHGRRWRMGRYPVDVWGKVLAVPGVATAAAG